MTLRARRRLRRAWHAVYWAADVLLSLAPPLLVVLLAAACVLLGRLP